jgi:hypothetical protein
MNTNVYLISNGFHQSFLTWSFITFFEGVCTLNVKPVFGCELSDVYKLNFEEQDRKLEMIEDCENRENEL